MFREIRENELIKYTQRRHTDAEDILVKTKGGAAKVLTSVLLQADGTYRQERSEV